MADGAGGGVDPKAVRSALAPSQATSELTFGPPLAEVFLTATDTV
jgi:hypothetical protein